jgi:hypothetical protein
MKQADIHHTLREAVDITHFAAVAATDKCLFSCASPAPSLWLICEADL